MDAKWFAEKLPEPEDLDRILSGDPVSALLNLVRTRAPIEPGFEGEPKDIKSDSEIAKLFEQATKAAEKLKKDKNPALSKKEIEALHAFVHLIARPALRVNADGETPGAPEPWPELDQHQQMVTHRIRGVGRLDTEEGKPAGTGWFVASELMMTNNHVAAMLCGINPHKNKNTWRDKLTKAVPEFNKTWGETPKKRPYWSPDSAPVDTENAPGRVDEILETHQDLDMALLKVSGVQDSQQIALPLGAKAPDEDIERVYVAGYPAVFAGMGLHTALTKLLFGGTSNIVHKRVSPGLLRGIKGPQQKLDLLHDASTLGGNSGSAIITFGNHRVVGLHYGGKYGTANYSVPLWRYKDDPFFGKHKLTFG